MFSSLSPDQLALVLLLLILPVIPNLWSIWHIFRHDFATPAEKKGWIGLNIFLPVVGGIIYFFVGRTRTISFPENQQATDIPKNTPQ